MPLDPYSIEAARPDDIPGLVALLGVLFSIESDFTPDAAAQERGLRGLLSRKKDAVVLVAHSSCGDAIGMISVQLVMSTAEGAPSAWVEDVVVDAAFRGRGVGRALVSAALDWARDRGATRAQLLMDVGNSEASLFYERLGWGTTRLVARRISL